MTVESTATAAFPPPLSSYPDGGTLLQTLAARIEAEPFNAIATGIFLLAILHTFAAARFASYAHRLQHRHEERARARGEVPRPG
ncbi:MAG TPA: hypothetical protein VF198_02925, partial [Vicinamibacterales bacterium]